MIDFSKVDWNAIKALCERVNDYEKKAKAKGLDFIFSVHIGIRECEVYSVLYYKMEGYNDTDLVKFNETDYFSKKDKFEEYLKEVDERIAGWDAASDLDAEYKLELEALNKKYGK